MHRWGSKCCSRKILHLHPCRKWNGKEVEKVKGRGSKTEWEGRRDRVECGSRKQNSPNLHKGLTNLLMKYSKHFINYIGLLWKNYIICTLHNAQSL